MNCNSLLRAWEHFKKQKHRWHSLRRIGLGHVESELTPPPPKNLDSRSRRPRALSRR